MSVADLMKHHDKHRATRANFAAIGYTEAYAWVLKDIKRFKRARPYTHKSGAVTWVALTDVDLSAG